MVHAQLIEIKIDRSISLKLKWSQVAITKGDNICHEKYTYIDNLFLSFAQTLPEMRACGEHVCTTASLDRTR